MEDYKFCPIQTRLPAKRKVRGRKIKSDQIKYTQLVRFIVVELTYSSLNIKFGICIIFTTNYFFSGR
jgi:hypothetical protein